MEWYLQTAVMAVSEMYLKASEIPSSFAQPLRMLERLLWWRGKKYLPPPQLLQLQQGGKSFTQSVCLVPWQPPEFFMESLWGGPLGSAQQ